MPQSLHLLLGSQLRFVKDQGFQLQTVSAGGREIEFLKNSGIAHVVVPMTRKITPIRDLVSLVRIVRVILRFRPDIVHTHTPKAGLLGMVASWICRIPVRLHTVAGLPIMELKGIKRLVLWYTEAITYRCSTNVYANSRGLFSYMGKNWPRHSIKFKIIGKGSSNGVDTSFFTRNELVNSASKKIRDQYRLNNTTFIFIGRIVKDKGIVELLEAFRLFIEDRPADLFLVGSFEPDLDPLPSKSLQFIKSNKHVHLVGFQDDVRPWLAASDIFILPSYREGFPNVVLQAGSMKLPSIVTDISGSNEVVIDDYSGLVVPVKKPDELLKAMITLADNPEKRKIFAENARQFIVKNFEQGYLWDELLKEYDRVQKNS